MVMTNFGKAKQNTLNILLESLTHTCVTAVRIDQDYVCMCSKVEYYVCVVCFVLISGVGWHPPLTIYLFVRTNTQSLTLV